MLKITIRIYRTHDFDLMALHQTGALKIGTAMKKAIIAYYNGEKFQFDITMPCELDMSQMPLMVTTSIAIAEKDSEGITKWLSEFRPGYRNCCLKNILRHFLEDPGIAYFRTDATRHQLIDLGAGTIMCRVHNHPTSELKGSRWLQKIATEPKKIKDPQKLEEISHALDYLKIPEQQPIINPIDQEMTWEPPEGSYTEEQQTYDQTMNMSAEPIEEEIVDDDFDAFAAFQKIRGG